MCLKKTIEDEVMSLNNREHMVTVVQNGENKSRQNGARIEDKKYIL